MTISTENFIDLLTDVQIEINAIHEALLIAEVEDLKLQGLREDARKERPSVREKIVRRLAALQSGDPIVP